MVPSRQISRLVFLTIAFVVSLSVLPAQSWVSSHGMDAPYQPPRYLSGYGVSDLPDSGERLQAARNDALAALSRQIRIRITSSEDIRTVDDGRGTRSRYTNTIQTATDLQVTGARYEISEERGRTHALAWIELAELRQQFYASGEDARTRLQTAMESFDRAAGRGDMESAERALGHADSALSALFDVTTVIRALDALAGRGPSGAGVQTEVPNPLELERVLMERRERLTRFQPADPQQAADLLARSLLVLLRDGGTAPPRQAPGATGRGAQVMPLLYQDADFSSSFGSRVAGLVSTSLARRMSPADTQLLDTVVIRGSYWPEQDRVEIQLTARDIQSGRVVAAAHTTIPSRSVDAATLRPANADIALAGAQSLLNDQIVSGGLELEVWTDKGRNERALVFEDGEYIQFYFRVNQPAFLQLSYQLASGETVLLEEQFYIGIDRVNRVVALPYRFQVVPPFGVERLIVTAHSTEPPPPDVIPRQISGQWYEAFRTPGDAVVRTRGLVREQNADGGGTAGQTRVGEASISITTVANSR
jgi:hypothetical protein